MSGPIERIFMLLFRIPTTKLSIQVVCMPGLHGVSRMLSGMAVLPSLAGNNRRCPWSTFFKSTKVPRVAVFSSTSGEVVCDDAIHELQKPDAAQTFPWSRTPWAELLHKIVLKFYGTDVSGVACEMGSFPYSLALTKKELSVLGHVSM